jgi:catechol 2,3-dioxygenase-like lactoylglutathione lyase family enzyme
VINKGVQQPRSFVGYELWQEIGDAERLLRDSGHEVERRTDIAPSTPDVLILHEPDTGTPLHLFQGQAPSGVDGYTPLRPTKLGHIAAFVPDLVSMQSFYQDLLGFRWSDTIADFFVFLRCNGDHHAANFMQSAKRQGMHHIAYEMRDLNHLQSMLDHLARNDYRLEWGPGRHGAGHNIFTYHHDPDGNVVELFTQLDVITDEAKGYFEPRPWHETFPQYPRTWQADLVAVNSWGPINRRCLITDCQCGTRAADTDRRHVNLASFDPATHGIWRITPRACRKVMTAATGRSRPGPCRLGRPGRACRSGLPGRASS